MNGIIGMRKRNVLSAEVCEGNGGLEKSSPLIHLISFYFLAESSERWAWNPGIYGWLSEVIVCRFFSTLFRRLLWAIKDYLVGLI